MRRMETTRRGAGWKMRRTEENGYWDGSDNNEAEGL
jgi:hypothetical protein